MTGKELGHTIVVGGKKASSGFSPLKVARTSPEFIAQLLEHAARETLDDEQKNVLITVLAGLPDAATVHDLENAILEYPDLTNILKTLHKMQTEGVFAGLISNPAD